MSTPDYPLLTVPGYELYQLAHLTTFVVDALARHRRAAEARDQPDRRAAAAVETPTDAADARPDTGQRIARRVPGRGGRPAQSRGYAAPQPRRHYAPQQCGGPTCQHPTLPLIQDRSGLGQHPRHRRREGLRTRPLQGSRHTTRLKIKHAKT